MRIAFISYEYPPDISQGGIATYLRQISKVLKKRGHDIEIFASSTYRDKTHFDFEFKVHRIKCQSVSEFNLLVLDRFSLVHETNPFDIVECPEIHAHSLIIQRKYPNLPFVIKFHTPSFLQIRLNNYFTSSIVKIRFLLGSIRRFHLNYFGKYQKNSDNEFIAAVEANNFISPSRSLAQIISKEWGISISKIQILPYPFESSYLCQSNKIELQTSMNVIFVGKLSVPKGIISLLKVIPRLVKQYPNVFFHLIGPDQLYHQKNIMMSQYINQKLSGFERNYKIYGGLDYKSTLQMVSSADVCVFPSIWENFPNVCLEAMTAGRAIVGSKNGGMSEMLSNFSGILVDSISFMDLSRSISWLLENPVERVKIGERARLKVKLEYNEQIIGAKTEQIFEQIIKEKNRGAQVKMNCYS